MVTLAEAWEIAFCTNLQMHFVQPTFGRIGHEIYSPQFSAPPEEQSR